MPFAEAKFRKYRCSNCFDCPSCGHTLTMRATSQLVSNPDNQGKSMPKKMYYLACGFCRWTTWDVNIPDKSVARGVWEDLKNPDTERANMDKYGLMSVATKRKGLVGAGKVVGVNENEEGTKEPSSEAVTGEEFTPLSDDLFTEPLQLASNKFIGLPKKELVLARKDDASMYENMQGQQEFKDNSSIVAFRKGNKLGVNFKVPPLVQEGDVKKYSLSETRLADERSLKEARGDYTFFWRGKPESEDRIHGVGFNTAKFVSY